MASLNIPADSPVLNGYQPPASSPAPVVPAPPGSPQAAADQQKADMAKYFPSGTSVTPGSPLASLVKTPNSDSGKPSSSATLPLNAGGNAAITATNTAPTQSTDPNAQNASALASAYSAQGVNITSDNIQQWINAGYDPKEAASMAAEYWQSNKEKQDELNTQQLSYSADLAKNNADYRAASEKLSLERSNAIHAGVAQAAKAGVFENQSSDQIAYGNAIGAQYDALQQELDAQAAAAKAATDSGNYAAVAKINSSMATMLQQGIASIQSRQQNATQLKSTQQNQAQTQYRDTLTQLPLTTADQMATLPPDVGQLTPDQLNTFTNTTAYQQGHAAGLSDQAILNDLRGLSQTGNFKSQAATLASQKAQNTELLANARLAIAQANLADKQGAALDAATIASTPMGKDFLAAFQVSAPGHSKQENSDVLSSLASFTQSGNTAYAKQTLTNYIFSNQPPATKTIIGGLQQVADYTAQLKAKILALPPDQQGGFWNGNFQDIAAKFGQNPNPQLQELASEFGHLSLLYKANVFGKRALVSNDPTLKNLFPSIKDTDSLNFSTLNGMLDTANTTLNSVVSSSIGPDLFGKIYGDGGVIGSAKSTTPPLKVAVPQGSTAGYSQSTGHWYAKDANGNVTQIQ